MMSKNIHLKLKKYATLRHQAEFELLEDLQIDDVYLSKGFVTDGATIPRHCIFIALLCILFGGLYEGFIAGVVFFIGWIFVSLAYMVPPFGRYALAAFAHDYLLQHNDRKYADNELKRLLTKMKIHGFVTFVIYNGVRLHSWIKSR